MFPGRTPRAFKIAVEQGRIGIHRQHARDADPDLFPLLDEFARALPIRRRAWRPFPLRVDSPHFPAGKLDQVRIGFARRVQTGLDRLHGAQIFDRSFLAGRDDQPPRCHCERRSAMPSLPVQCR